MKPLKNFMMKIYKSRNVKTPNRGTEESAGIDFYIPEDIISDPVIYIQPGEGVNIPSGIHANIPKGYALIAHNKCLYVLCDPIRNCDSKELLR